MPEQQRPVDDPRFIAAVRFLGTTGAQDFRFGYFDDEKPTVWHATASWIREGRRVYEAAGAMTPVDAVLRLCEQVTDGGRCTHCDRVTGFDAEQLDAPFSSLICWYQYDPELKVIRRGCEGSTDKGGKSD